MGKHEVVEQVEQQVGLWRKVFCRANLPHLAFAVITIIWASLQFDVGPAAVAPPINAAWAAIAGLWYSYLIKPKEGEPK